MLEQINRNAKASIKAAGVAAVGQVVRQMKSGYGAPIRRTGDLMRDVNFEVVNDTTINIGNSLNYATFVHEGTSRTKGKGRPYIKDGIFNGKDRILAVFRQELKRGL